jgi:hypothetical protein
MDGRSRRLSFKVPASPLITLAAIMSSTHLGTQRQVFCDTCLTIVALWLSSVVSTKSRLWSSSSWPAPRAHRIDKPRDASGAAGTASIPRRAAKAAHSSIAAFGTRSSAYGMARPAAAATARALRSSSSHRAARPTKSTDASRAMATRGERKLLVMKRPIAAPIRRLFSGTTAVWGIGRPRGRRKRATTANQSAHAPTMPASAKAAR